MRRLQYLILVVMLVGVSLAAKAQPMRMSPEERTEQMAKSLSLSDEQKVKVLDIFKGSDEVRKKAFEDHQGDRDAMRDAMQQIRKDTDAKLKEVLTEEQYTKWEKMRSEMPGRNRPGS